MTQLEVDFYNTMMITMKELIDTLADIKTELQTTNKRLDALETTIWNANNE